MSFDTASVSNLPFGTEQYSRIRFLNANKGYVLGRSNFFTGKLQNLYETNDGGQSWNSIHADSAYNFSVDFVMNAAGNGLIIGNDRPRFAYHKWGSYLADRTATDDLSGFVTELRSRR
ncbi:MAG: hypothetical protein U5L96_17480 [Owenweeksia sp.]|nr:hypothetical protein [Owenweeksia sp.]